MSTMGVVTLGFLMAITIQWSPPETMPLGVLMGVYFCNKFIILKPGKYEIVK